MRETQATISTIYTDKYVKNLFTMICTRYGSSASAVLEDFMDQYTRVHYLDFLEDPIFEAASLLHPPEREWDQFSMEIFRLQGEALESKYGDTGSKKLNVLTEITRQMDKIEKIFED